MCALLFKGSFHSTAIKSFKDFSSLGDTCGDILTTWVIMSLLFSSSWELSSIWWGCHLSAVTLYVRNKVLEVDNRCWKMWDLDLNLPPACFSLAGLVPLHALHWAWLKSCKPSPLLFCHMKRHLGHQNNGFGCIPLFFYWEHKILSWISRHDPRYSPSGATLSCKSDTCPGWELGLSLWVLSCPWSCREGCSSIPALLLEQVPECQQLLSLQINAGSPFIFTNQV